MEVFCRSSSTREESWWTRSRQPKTHGSARLWARSRALPPPLHPRPPRLPRTVPPSQPLHPSSLIPRREMHNKSWRKKPWRNAVFLFPSGGSGAEGRQDCSRRENKGTAKRRPQVSKHWICPVFYSSLRLSRTKNTAPSCGQTLLLQNLFKKRALFPRFLFI